MPHIQMPVRDLLGNIPASVYGLWSDMTDLLQFLDGERDIKRIHQIRAVCARMYFALEGKDICEPSPSRDPTLETLTRRSQSNLKEFVQDVWALLEMNMDGLQGHKETINVFLGGIRRLFCLFRELGFAEGLRESEEKFEQYYIRAQEDLNMETLEEEFWSRQQ